MVKRIGELVNDDDSLKDSESLNVISTYFPLLMTSFVVIINTRLAMKILKMGVPNLL